MSLSIEEEINRLLIIIDPLLFYLSVVRSLKKFYSIYEFLEENDLLFDHQSGFRPSDSCEYQLLSIVHDIYISFDCIPPLDVRGIFLDICKVFDRVWHDGLIYKVKCIGINGMFLKLITSFLENRFQRVVLNG